MFGDKTLCRCCSEGPPPPLPCFLTIRFLDCGVPTAGAAITGIPYIPAGESGPDVPLGATDGDGNFDFSAVDPADYRCKIRVTYDGASFEFVVCYGVKLKAYCDRPLNICYEHAHFVVNSTSGSNPALQPSPPGDPTYSGPGTATYTSGSVEVDYKRIGTVPCGSSALPLHGIHVYPTVPGYLDNCIDATVNCGDDATFDVPMFYFADDYIAASSLCDLGCEAYGEGPLHRGLLPKKLFLTWSAVDFFGNDVGYLYFGAHDGVPLEVNWDGVAYPDGNPRWYGDCLDGSSISCEKVYFGSTPPPPGPDFYKTARASIVFDPGALSYVPDFTPYNQAGCVFDPTDHGPCSVGGGVSALASPCQLTSPVDVTSSVVNSLSVTITCHVTE